MPSSPDPAYARVGALLRRRRIEINPDYSNRRLFVDERMPGRYRTVNKIERGQRGNYEEDTFTLLEVAYDLAPGSIARALDGADLEPAHPGRAETSQEGERAGAAPPAGGGLDMDEEFTRAFEPHLATVRDRVEVARAARPDASRLPGSLLFPASPFSAMAWDAVMRDGHSEEEAVKLVAQYLTLRGFERAAERNGSSASTR